MPNPTPTAGRERTHAGDRARRLFTERRSRTFPPVDRSDRSNAYRCLTGRGDTLVGGCGVSPCG